MREWQGYDLLNRSFKRCMIFLITVTLLVTMAPFFMSGTAEGLSVPAGPLLGDTTWSISDSPVVLEGNSTVPSGSSLSIDAGVVVKLKANSWLDIQGRMDALGTPASPVTFEREGATDFHRINVSGGGSALFENVVISGSSNGIMFTGVSTLGWVYNSTVDSNAAGIYAQSSSLVWAVNCSFMSMSNVSVSTNAELREGNWLFFNAMKDDGSGPFQGADLIVTATKPQDTTWTVYDSRYDDPKTDGQGRLPPIRIEQYKHAGQTSSARVMVKMKMTASSARWTDEEYPVYMGSNLNYTWWMDFTAPPSPENFRATARGGTWILVSWDMSDVSDVRNFNISFKLDWQSDKDFENHQPSSSAREYNITNLLEERNYTLKMESVDGSDNPSIEVGPINAWTLDITEPLAPTDPKLIGFGGTWANISWWPGNSTDTIGYNVLVNDTLGGLEKLLFVEGKQTLHVNITGLTSETDYQLWVQSVDDGEVPNVSPPAGPVVVRTKDITPPVQPLLKIALIDPPQFIPGTLYYNSSQVALNGTVEGEDRTFIDVFVDDLPYVNPIEDAPRFSTFEGEFLFFISVHEGLNSIRVRSVDPAGNIGHLSETSQVFIDTKAPAMGLVGVSGTQYIDAGEQWVMETNISDEGAGVHEVVIRVKGNEQDLEYYASEVGLNLDIGTYNVTVEAVDAAGNRNWTSFVLVAREPDVTLPVATIVSPADPSSVDLVPVFKIRMSEAVSWSSLQAILHRSDAVSGDDIGLSIDIDEGNLSIMFTSLEPLESGTNYTFELSNIVDLRGNEGNDIILHFTTISADRMDTDKDGIPDYYEVQRNNFLNPSDASDAQEDQDKDGLTNLQEFLNSTDPEMKDTDGDGMWDAWELENGLSPTDNSDALKDADSDGYSNLEEYEAGSDPNDDTDLPKTSSNDGNWFIIALGISLVLLVLIIIIVLFVFIFRRKAKQGRTNEVTGYAGAPDSYGGIQEAAKIECPSCGISLDAGSTFCPECGITISKEGPDGEPTEPLDTSFMYGLKDQEEQSPPENPDDSLVDGTGPEE